MRYVLLIGLFLFGSCAPSPKTLTLDGDDAEAPVVMQPLLDVPPAMSWGVSLTGAISSDETRFMGTVQPDMLVDSLREKVRPVRMFELQSAGRPMGKVEIRFDGEVQHAWTTPRGAEIFDLKAILSHAIERPTVVVIRVQALGEGDWSLEVEPK